MDAPVSYIAPRFIHTHCFYSKLGPTGAAALASAAWPAANRAIYVPFSIPFPFVARRVFIANGGTVAGTNHVDIGVYTLGGAKIFSTGSQVLTGTNTIQYFTLSTDQLLSPGPYFFGVALDSTDTALATAVSVNNQRMAGVYQQATAFTLPASMTIATVASTFVPLVGMTSTDSGF